MELGAVDVLLGRLSCSDQVEDRYVLISIGQLDAISKRASKILSAAENVERLHRCERLRKDIEVKALHDLVVLLKQEKQASELWISFGYFRQMISTPERIKIETPVLVLRFLQKGEFSSTSRLCAGC